MHAESAYKIIHIPVAGVIRHHGNGQVCAQQQTLGLIEPAQNQILLKSGTGSVPSVSRLTVLDSQ